MSMDVGKVNYGQNTTSVEAVAQKSNFLKDGWMKQLAENKNKTDSFQKVSIPLEEVCGCYPNYQVVTGMPKSVFTDQFGYDMQKDISNHMTDFYAGKISEDEINEYFNQYCSDMRNYCTKTCRTTGTNEEANKQVIGQVYEIFAKENQRAARHANDAEGVAYNETYGHPESGNDWAYYNSDYYYQCEDTHSFLKDVAKEMTEKWGTSEVDTEEIEKNSVYTVDGGFDFNSGWNFLYRNQVGRSSMADESMIPPKDFVFFYKESISKEDGFQGGASVSIGDKKYSTDIAFSISHYDLSGQIFKADDLFADEVSDNAELKDFLGNISVFRRAYAYHTGINDKFGNYVPQYK